LLIRYSTEPGSESPEKWQVVRWVLGVPTALAVYRDGLLTHVADLNSLELYRFPQYPVKEDVILGQTGRQGGFIQKKRSMA